MARKARRSLTVSPGGTQPLDGLARKVGFYLSHKSATRNIAAAFWLELRNTNVVAYSSES